METPKVHHHKSKHKNLPTSSTTQSPTSTSPKPIKEKGNIKKNRDILIENEKITIVTTTPSNEDENMAGGNDGCDGVDVVTIDQVEEFDGGRGGSGGGVDDEIITELRESVLSDDLEAENEDKLQKGILGYMDRQIKTPTTPLTHSQPQPPTPTTVITHKPPQSLSDPQGSPAQRSNRSRSSNDNKSPRRKRSKSESRRRRERKLIAAGEMEVRQANETLMKYLKQCTQINDASLSGELEIDKNLEDNRKVYRKTKAQRDRRSILVTSKTNLNNNNLSGNGRQQNNNNNNSDLTQVLNELCDDIIPQNGEIYNPFTPVISPTDGPPSRIDKIYIQTQNGYRSVDNNFYKASNHRHHNSNHHHHHQSSSSSRCLNIEDDCGSGIENGSIQNGVHLSCVIQRIWINITNICHGLLGGLALAHLLFIFTTKPYDWIEGSIKHYSSFAEIYANTFYCLAVICMVSIFDRYAWDCKVIYYYVL